MHAFVSHTHRDKPSVTPFVSRLRLAGVDIWLDEWEIRPGDSIPGKVNDALGVVDTVLIFWSHAAAASTWIYSEMDAALALKVAEGSPRVIPVRLDDAEMPSLLRPLKYLSLESGDEDRALRSLLNIDSEAELLKRMQQTIHEAGLEYRYFPGVGVMVGCPRCGCPSPELESWGYIDYARDDTYRGAKCPRCGWADASED
ncbi:toll/interleukin-1 receptor domain-containing protein [Streptomyces microflavus]|uniref:toll/interleukin-1 receptor domain-containing protein n=1 Tax=Streptomyces microflavus TaxID=1919 RepID=UPI0038236F8B